MIRWTEIVSVPAAAASRIGDPYLRFPFGLPRQVRGLIQCGRDDVRRRSSACRDTGVGFACNRSGVASVDGIWNLDGWRRRLRDPSVEATGSGMCVPRRAGNGIRRLPPLRHVFLGVLGFGVRGTGNRMLTEDKEGEKGGGVACPRCGCRMFDIQACHMFCPGCGGHLDCSDR